MESQNRESYMRGFIPYALAAFLVGLVGGFVAGLGPAFVKDMEIAYNNTTWTALAMAMSAATCAPILGKLGDAIGRRTTLLAGIAVFGVGNVLSAVAPSLLFMLVARFIVGIGMAAIAPVVMSYIVTEFPQEAMAKGFSLYMLISSAAVIFGPTLGGVILEFYGWRILLWVCAAISLAVFLACLLAREERRGERKPLKEFDLPGAVMVLFFFSLLLCLPSFGQNFGWSSKVFLVVLAAASLSLIGLVIVERSAKNPILQGDFVARRTFILCVVTLFLTQGLMQANMTNTIVFVNYTNPQNTIISSYAISIMYLGMSLGAVILGPLSDRLEPKIVLTGSLIFTGIGCAVMLLYSETVSLFLLAVSLGVLGFGLGGNGTIFMKVVLSGLPADKAGAGTGAYGLFRDLAAPFGVAIFVPLFTNQISNRIAMGTDERIAAVHSIRVLAVAEILCIAAGIVAVQMLPKIYGQKRG